MKLSIVIPTYNMADALRKTLYFLSSQAMRDGLMVEIIVADDGSEDDTALVVESFKLHIPYLRRAFRPRDGLSCRALARNLGISLATGDVVVFLDSGMAVSRAFAQRIADFFSNASPSAVLLHSMLGMFVNIEDEDASLLDDLDPESYEDISIRLQKLHRWRDQREGIFDLVNDDLNCLPAPWAFVFGGCLSVPRELVVSAGGFDNDYLNWGVEDTDFGWRLYTHGATFHVDRHYPVIHLPHPTSALQEKLYSNRANKALMHRKHRSLETELYRFYATGYVNFMVNKYNNLALDYVLPTISENVISQVNEYLRGAERSVLIGVDNLRIAAQLNTTHVFTHNRATHDRLARGLDRVVTCTLGTDTAYSDRYFDVAVVTDFMRLLPKRLLIPFVAELHRIARRVVILWDSTYVSVVTRSDEPWLSFDGFLDILQDSPWHSQAAMQTGVPVIELVTPTGT